MFYKSMYLYVYTALNPNSIQKSIKKYEFEFITNNLTLFGIIEEEGLFLITTEMVKC